MLRRVLFPLTVFFAAFSTPARADVALLVHGYLGDASTWETSGVTAALATTGWQSAGVIVPSYPDIILPAAHGNGTKRVYAIELPSTAPLNVQSDLLTRALRALESRHRGEPVSLVGHSAGGVVARMSVVRGGAGQVKRLVTIAAPHLGTERALQALEVTHAGGPLNILKDLFGGQTYHSVKQSWPVLLDLAPASPGSTLHWLNVQNHPDIEYISIVRGASYGLGDALVPGYSQDMNNVPGIHGRAKTYVVSSAHELSAEDGRVLAQLLR